MPPRSQGSDDTHVCKTPPEEESFAGWYRLDAELPEK